MPLISAIHPKGTETVMEQICGGPDGSLYDKNFTKPMPWIGIYVAAATMACAILIASDVLHAVIQRKTWFPCKFFSLNATSFTLIGIAIKFSADINTPMPRNHDQLAKLSGTILMCTFMGKTIPSLGTMENKEIFFNVLGLAILVITLIVDICIQLKTGAINKFRIEHVIVMCLMLLLLAIVTSVGIAVPAVKRHLEMNYNMEHRSSMIRASDETTENLVVEKLRKDLARMWFLAHTYSPQFLIGRSALSLTSTTICLFGLITLLEAITRAHTFPKDCSGQSSYKWTTSFVFFSQTIAVGVGSIAPFVGVFNAALLASETKLVENYWLETLEELRDCSLSTRFNNQCLSRLAHDAKRWVLELVILLQQVVVAACRLWFLFTYSLLLSIFCFSFFLPGVLCHEVFEKEDGDLGLLYLERMLIKRTEYWFKTGQKKQPKYLIDVLMQNSSTKQVILLSFCRARPPCWALVVATLTTISTAIPHASVDSNLLKKLLKGVNEGLRYAKFIEKKLDAAGDLRSLRKAADVVWVKADLYRKWLHEVLDDLRAENTTILVEKLYGIADSCFKDSMVTAGINTISLVWDENSSKWPIEALAAYAMMKITEQLKQEELGSWENLFARIRYMISSTFRDCFKNLGHIISKEFDQGTSRGREERVRLSIILLGETEEILRILEPRNVSSSMTVMPSIAEQNEDTLPFTSSDNGITIVTK